MTSQTILLPDSEFDTYIKTTLTKRHTKNTKENPDIYTILPHYTDFDFIDETCQYYDIEFRIVHFLADDGRYVCVATSLPEEDFPLAEIKKLYSRKYPIKLRAKRNRDFVYRAAQITLLS